MLTRQESNEKEEDRSKELDCKQARHRELHGELRLNISICSKSYVIEIDLLCNT